MTASGSIFCFKQFGNKPTIRKIGRNVTNKKIAPRIYTSNFNEPEDVIIRRYIFTILGKLYPSAVLSLSSALEFKPTTANQIFVFNTYTKEN